MIVEVGKSYKQHDGERGYVCGKTSGGFLVGWRGGTYHCDAEGVAVGDHRMDLIAPWDEPAPAEWTATKPTEPGRYWWCDGKGGDLYHFDIGKWFFEHGKLPATGGYWLPCTPPPAYIAPEPPKPPKPPQGKWYRGLYQGEWQTIQAFPTGFVVFIDDVPRVAIASCCLDTYGFTNVEPITEE